MVLGDLFSLISLIKNFVDGNRDLDRSFFEDFIQPAWQSFVKIHEQYEKSLHDYAQLLTEEMNTNHLSEKIAENVFYSAALRLELSQLVKHNVQADQAIQDKGEQLLSDFAQAMIEYFNSRRAFQTVWKVTSDPDGDRESIPECGYYGAIHDLANPRSVIVYALILIRDHSDSVSLKELEYFKKAVPDAFIVIMTILQYYYTTLADSYHALKAEMLKT